MRAKIRIPLIFISVIICSGVAYLAGYRNGHSSAVRDETKFGIVSYLNLYKFEQQGDTNRLNNWLRFLVFSHSDYYDKYFSNEIVTDVDFIQRLNEARAIAYQERTQVVDLATLTNQMNEETGTNHPFPLH
jgi:hypothetical protein